MLLTSAEVENANASFNAYGYGRERRYHWVYTAHVKWGLFFAVLQSGKESFSLHPYHQCLSFDILVTSHYHKTFLQAFASILFEIAYY